MLEANEPFDGQRNTADVIIIDGLPPEEGAMSQALYSRMPKSILFLITKVLKKGAEGFMKIFYSGYGHNSIGDCGSTTLYIENVSMLAAKAIQNWSLYNGQEASTRYLDFSGRTIVNPLGGFAGTQYLYIPKEKISLKGVEAIEHDFVDAYQKTSSPSSDSALGKSVQLQFMAFYEKHMPAVKLFVAELNPKAENEDEAQYQKAVNARAFDIMRAFIPAGMTTLVSWHSNLRQLRDHLDIIKYHPCEEVSRIAQTANAGLQAVYPASFDRKEYPETETFWKLRAKETSYFPPQSDTFYIEENNLRFELVSPYMSLLSIRPKKTEVPHEIGEAGSVRVSFPIDFGSFRDVQRHRKGVCKMPLLTTSLGFNQWYLDRLPEGVRIEAEALLEVLVPVINGLHCSEEDRQYYIPMGFNVFADFTWTLDQCFYVAELRSSETVHQTLRAPAQKIGKWIQKRFPDAALYVDWREETWSYKRGSQDIIEKS